VKGLAKIDHSHVRCVKLVVHPNSCLGSGDTVFVHSCNLSSGSMILLRKQGPDLQNILRQSYDYLTIMRKLLSTYDRRLIYNYKTSYEGRKAFLRYDSLAEL